MKNFTQVFICTHFFALLSFVFAEIEIITIQQGLDGYARCRDTYITDTLDAPPQGDNEELVLQGYHCLGCIDQRVVIHFDLTEIDENLDIGRVIFSLYCSSDAGLEAFALLYAVTNKWDEDYTTWEMATETEKWDSLGGDFSETKIDSTEIPAQSAEQWHDFNVTELVKEWLKKPDDNLGFLVQMNVAMTRIFYLSSENQNIDKRPKITIMHGEGDYESPNVTVKSPNGGEVIVESTREIIKWTATDNEEVIGCVLYFKDKDWHPWEFIDSVEGNEGEYEWIVPDQTSANCLIKIRAYDATGNSADDESDTYFEIEKVTGIVPHSIQSNTISDCFVTVINMQGRVLFTFKTTDLSNIDAYTKVLPAGIHIVDIKTSEKKLVGKFRLIKMVH